MNFFENGAVTILIVGCLFAPWAAVAGENQESAAVFHAAAGSNIPVAEVNGKEITMVVLTKKIQQLTVQRYRKQSLTNELYKQIRDEALDMLILEELAFQRAVKNNVQISSEELAAYIAKEKDKHRDGKHFQSYLKVMSMTEEEFREISKRKFMIELAVEKDFDEQVDIPEKDLRLIYENIKDQMVQEEQVQVTDIVFFLDADLSDSLQQVEKIRLKLVAELNGDTSGLGGESFYYVNEEAKLQSDQNPVLYETAKKLKPGEISVPINENDTYHIVKLTGYKPRIEKSFEDAAPEIKRKLQEQNKQKALDGWFASLKNNADIKIHNLEVN